MAGSSRPRCQRANVALNPQQLDVEDQCRVGGDDAAGTARAVAELGRDDQRALAADLHAGDTFVPSLYHLPGAEPEAEWRAAIDRAVEFLALVAVRLLQPAGVMHRHVVARRGFGAGADFVVAIDEAAGKRGHAELLCCAMIATDSKRSR